MISDTGYGLVEQQVERDYRFVLRLTAIIMLFNNLYYEFASMNELKTRIYLPYPAFEFFAAIPDSVNFVLQSVLIASLCAILFRPQTRIACLLVLACELFKILEDVNRFRHGPYMQSFTLLALGAVPLLTKEQRLTAVKIMLCGVYFWAGFHKINCSFYTVIFPNFTSDIYDYRHPSSSPFIYYPALAFMYAVPFVEAGIGVMLLFPASRKLGSLFALAMLTVILSCIHPPHDRLNYAVGIWTWNLWLFTMEWRLFWYGANLSAPFFLFSRSWFSRGTVVLFCLSPALAMWFSWYYIPGFKMYTGNRLEASVSFKADENFTAVPQPLKDVLLRRHEITMTQWESAEQNKFFRGYSPALMKHGTSGLCRYLDHPQDAKLTLLYPPPFYTTVQPEETFPLCPSAITPANPH